MVREHIVNRKIQKKIKKTPYLSPKKWYEIKVMCYWEHLGSSLGT
jgi:hypothetical protein